MLYPIRRFVNELGLKILYFAFICRERHAVYNYGILVWFTAMKAKLLETVTRFSNSVRTII